jgi:hypothetical protein
LAPDETQKEDAARYCLRLDGDSLGVYDSEGYLIKSTQIRAALLPAKERERLASGIWVDSWNEAGLLLQDYE